MSLTVSAADRVAFVGKTGSGKSYAAGLLALAIPRLVVIDPKGTLGDRHRARSKQYLWNLADWDSAAGRAARQSIARGNPGRLRVPAPLDNDYEPYFDWAYRMGGITVYIDEMYGVTNGATPGRWLNALYTRGRELGIGVWAATQRPRRVPVVMLSEAEWLFLFRLSNPDDRRRLADEIGPMALQKLDRYQFLLYHDQWDAPRLVRRLTANVREYRGKGSA